MKGKWQVKFNVERVESSNSLLFTPSCYVATIYGSIGTPVNGIAFFSGGKIEQKKKNKTCSWQNKPRPSRDSLPREDDIERKRKSMWMSLKYFRKKDNVESYFTLECSLRKVVGRNENHSLDDPIYPTSDPSITTGIMIIKSVEKTGVASWRWNPLQNVSTAAVGYSVWKLFSDLLKTQCRDFWPFFFFQASSCSGISWMVNWKLLFFFPENIPPLTSKVLFLLFMLSLEKKKAKERKKKIFDVFTGCIGWKYKSSLPDYFRKSFTLEAWTKEETIFATTRFQFH